MWMGEAEGLAAMIRDQAGYSTPTIDPWELAADLEVGVEYGPRSRRSNLRREAGRWVARLDPSEPARRQATQLAHEIGHALAIRYGLPNTERVAWRLACALLLPRDDFETMLRASGGWVHPIVEASPFVSHELVARRFVGLRSSYVLRVEDVAPQRRRYTVASDGWRCPPDLLPTEADALAIALDSRSPVEPVGGVRAWTVEEGAHVRAFVLSDGDVFTSG